MRMCLLLLLIVTGCVTTDLGPEPEPDPQPTPSPLPPPPPEPAPQPVGEPAPQPGAEPDPQPTLEPDPVPDPTQPEPEPSAQPEPQPTPEPSGQPEAPEPEAPEPEAPEPEAPPMPPATECMQNVDCGADQQCYGLRCFPATQICYCYISPPGRSPVLLPDGECDKWASPDFFNMAVPYVNPAMTYTQLRDDIQPDCRDPGPTATGEDCMRHTDCAGGLCLNTGMGTSFCSQRCDSAEECNALMCTSVNTPIAPRIPLCVR